MDEGEKLLKRSLELRPNDPAPMFQLAQLVNAQGKPEEAAKLLEAVVAQLPNYNQAHVLLARVYFKLKRTEDAKREQAIIARLTAEQQKNQPTSESQKLADPNDRSLKNPLPKSNEK